MFICVWVLVYSKTKETWKKKELREREKERACDWRRLQRCIEIEDESKKNEIKNLLVINDSSYSILLCVLIGLVSCCVTSSVFVLIVYKLTCRRTFEPIFQKLIFQVIQNFNWNRCPFKSKPQSRWRNDKNTHTNHTWILVIIWSRFPLSFKLVLTNSFFLSLSMDQTLSP